MRPTTKPPESPKKFDPKLYTSVTLHIEEVLQIKQAFDIFDEDGSGKLDPSQLVHAFQNLGFQKSNKMVYQILSQLENDQSNGIDFPQFIKLATAKISEKDNRAEINKVFNSFDNSHAVKFIMTQGKITVAELSRVAKELQQDMQEEEINTMFAKADLDDDGFVTAEDFYNIMTHRVYWDSVK